MVVVVAEVEAQVVVVSSSSSSSEVRRVEQGSYMAAMPAQEVVVNIFFGTKRLV